MWLSLPFLCRLLQRGRIPQLLALAHFDHYCTYNENRISLAKSRHSSFTQKNKAVVDVDGTTEKEHEYLQYPSLSAETPFLFPPFFFLLVTGPVLRYQVSRMRTSIQHGGPPLPTGSSIGRIPLSVTSHDDVTPTGKESVPVGEMKQRLGGDPPTTGDGGGRGTKNKGGQEEARKAAPFSRYAKQGEREKFRRPVLGRLFQRPASRYVTFRRCAVTARCEGSARRQLFGANTGGPARSTRWVRRISSALASFTPAVPVLPWRTVPSVHSLVHFIGRRSLPDARRCGHNLAEIRAQLDGHVKRIELSRSRGKRVGSKRISGHKRN